MSQNAGISDAISIPHPLISIAAQNHSCIALHRFVSQVISRLPQQATMQTGLIANTIQQNLLISTDKDILETVVSSLLGTVLLYGNDNSIQLSAKLIGNITLMHIKTNDSGQLDALVKSIYQLEPMAQSMGGCITVTCGKFHGINLTFTFINQ